MRAALVIAAKDLRQRLRNRTAIVVAVIAPFGLAAIFSMLLGGVDEPLELDYGFVDLDRTELSAGLRTGPLAAVEEAGLATITDAESADAARQAIDDADLDAALVVPEGFAAAVTGGEGAELEVIGSIDAGLATDILESLADSYLAELQGVRLAVAASVADGAAPDEIPGLAERAAATEVPIRLTDVAVESREMSQTTYFAASMAIFFLFFTAQFGILSLLGERRNGTLARLVAAPIRPWAIILGKAIGTLVLGIVSMSVLVLASSVLLGADWGPPLGVAALVVAAVVSAMGITALITTLARTEEQAGGWNAIVAVTLAILGGAFFDLTQAPQVLQVASRVTPHAWFLDGLDALSTDSATALDAWPAVVALLGIGLVAGAIGLARSRGLVMSR